MIRKLARPLVAAAAASALFALALPTLAEEKELGWSDVAEFSLVATDGNSETQTLGFKNIATRTWEKSLFVLKAGAIRAESTTVTRTAIGTGQNNFRLDERSETEKTAENYYLNGRYGHEISKRLFWYTGAGWERNRFAGIQNRYLVEGGVGNIWRDRDDLKFATSYALTFTDQEDVVDAPDVDDSFIGARFGWEYLNKFGDNTTYANTLTIDGSLEETSDYRADMVNSLAVAMNSRVALKVSLQWLYENEPAFQEVDLFTSAGTPTGETVLVELDDLDTILTVSLVVNF